MAFKLCNPPQIGLVLLIVALCNCRSFGEPYEAREDSRDVEAVQLYNSGVDALAAGDVPAAARGMRSALELMPHLLEARLTLSHLLTDYPGLLPEQDVGEGWREGMRMLGDLVREAAAAQRFDMVLKGAGNAMEAALHSAQPNVHSLELRELFTTAEAAVREVCTGSVRGGAVTVRRMCSRTLSSMGRWQVGLGDQRLGSQLLHTSMQFHSGNASLSSIATHIALSSIAIRAGEGGEAVQRMKQAHEHGQQLLAAHVAAPSSCSRQLYLALHNQAVVSVDLAELLRESNMMREAHEHVTAAKRHVAHLHSIARGCRWLQAPAPADSLRLRFLSLSIDRAMWDWSSSVSDEAAIAATLSESTADSMALRGLFTAGTPFDALSLQLPAGTLRNVATAFVDSIKVEWPRMATCSSLRRVGATDRRLRLAYLSYDFRDHILARMIVSLFRLHDRRTFAVDCYHFGPLSGYTSAIREACDSFVLLVNTSDESAAKIVGGSQPDVLVDLSVHMTGSRPAVLKQHPAWLSVNYVGYPGTGGDSLLDYIIGDAVLLPPEQQHEYSEAIVLLPHSYQVNSYTFREPFARLQQCSVALMKLWGLPANRTVLATLNSARKLEPRVFTVWSQVLARDKSTVLWVLSPRGNATVAQRNLLQQAAAHGVHPSRILFAPFVDAETHRARLACVSVYLDTVSYGGHTSAADALWAFVPVVACPTQMLQGRVALSLMHSLGVQYVSAALSLKDYGDLAYVYAARPAITQWVSSHLAKATFESTGTFQPVTMARSLEQAYLLMTEARTRADNCSAVPGIVVAPRLELALQQSLAAGCSAMRVEHLKFQSAGNKLVPLQLESVARLECATPAHHQVMRALTAGMDALTAGDPVGAENAARRILAAIPAQRGASQLLALSSANASRSPA